MNIEELKMAWQDFDRKLQSARSVNEKIIISMIRQRSHSRLERVITIQTFSLIYLTAMVLLGIAVLVGNPFDYQQFSEFIPVGIYTLCMIFISIGLLRSLRRLKKVEINTGDVDSSLKKIIEIYESPARYLHNALRLLLFSSVVLFPLSFLPRKIESMGWSGALQDTLIPIVLSVIILYVAYRFGAFKDTNVEDFRRYREELISLKSSSEELRLEV